MVLGLCCVSSAACSPARDSSVSATPYQHTLITHSPVKYQPCHTLSFLFWVLCEWLDTMWPGAFLQITCRTHMTVNVWSEACVCTQTASPWSPLMQIGPAQAQCGGVGHWNNLNTHTVATVFYFLTLPPGLTPESRLILHCWWITHVTSGMCPPGACVSYLSAFRLHS